MGLENMALEREIIFMLTCTELHQNLSYVIPSIILPDLLLYKRFRKNAFKLKYIQS